MKPEQDNQLSIQDRFEPISDSPTTKKEKVILSPKELSQQGKKFKAEDEKRWTEAVWQVQRRERNRGNWINWFEACELFRTER